MKTGILGGTILLLLIGINANLGSSFNPCLTCSSLDTIIPKDTLERIKQDAVREATDDLLEKVDSLRDVRDNLQFIVDSMRSKPQRVLVHADTVVSLNGRKVWCWYYWKSGKKFLRFSHVEIIRL
jgi:hypothetical protein